MNRSYLLNGINILFRPVKSLCYPAHIQIEPVNDCNLRCLSCPRAKLVKNPVVMPLERFKRIIDEIMPRYVTLSGLGETMMHPEICDMISWCVRKKIYVNVTTNMTLLDHAKAAALLESGLNEISVSLDAADREAYRSVRGQDLWDRLIDNLKGFISLRQERKQVMPVVRAQFVLQARNIDQVVAFTMLCKELNVDSVYFQHLSLNGIEERREALVGGLTKERVTAALREAHVFAKKAGIPRTNLAEMIRDFDLFWEQYLLHNHPKRRVCLNPWYDAYINVDGRVQPCCAFAGDVAGVYFGNMFDESFKEVYNGVQYRSFRKALKKGKRPYVVCRRCYPIGLGDIVGQVLRPK
ncbi:MAG: radical SAM protein [Chitinispirillaceae bacterium]|nr:radical SAM protein [Chitinispirillaceae bacterium]